MNFIPQGEVYLLNVPIESDNKNQLYFSSQNAQTNYFQDQIVASFEDFTYIRQDGVISVPVDKESLYNCNYVMYRNANFGTKWFYAFIDELEYRNPNCTYLHITTDYWQTWCFDIIFKKSWIRRMHEAVDTIGYNLMPEPVEIGEQRIEQPKDLWNYSKMMIIVASAVDLDAVPEDTGLGQPAFPKVEGGIYNGVYSGSALFAWEATTEGINALNAKLERVASFGQVDSITGIYMLPYEAISTLQQGKHKLTQTGAVVKYAIQGSVNHGTFGGYVPKNNKLYTYPYSYTLISNNTGDIMELHNELFSGVPFYYVECDCSATATLDLRTANYNVDGDYLNHISIQGLPQCSWNYDAYNNWLGANASSLVLSTVASSINAMSGIVANPTPTGIGVAGAKTLDTIVSAGSQVVGAKRLPDTARGTVSGTFLVGANRLKFRQYTVCCRYEFAKQIDDFFSRYGYAVNQLHDIQLGTRENWNYIQTQDVNILGSIPNDDLQQIKNMFDNGVTFWNDPDTFGDYSQSNNPV